MSRDGPPRPRSPRLHGDLGSSLTQTHYHLPLNQPLIASQTRPKGPGPPGTPHLKGQTGGETISPIHDRDCSDRGLWSRAVKSPLALGHHPLPEAPPCSRAFTVRVKPLGLPGAAGFEMSPGGAWLSPPVEHGAHGSPQPRGLRSISTFWAGACCTVGAAQGMERHFGDRLAGIWWLSQRVIQARMIPISGLGDRAGSRAT